MIRLGLVLLYILCSGGLEADWLKDADGVKPYDLSRSAILSDNNPMYDVRMLAGERRVYVLQEEGVWKDLWQVPHEEIVLDLLVVSSDQYIVLTSLSVSLCHFSGERSVIFKAHGRERLYDIAYREGVLWLATSLGLYQKTLSSSNGWIRCYSSQRGVNAVEDTSRGLYILGAQGLLVSSDQGQTWDLLKRIRSANVIAADVDAEEEYQNDESFVFKEPSSIYVAEDESMLACVQNGCPVFIDLMLTDQEDVPSQVPFRDVNDLVFAEDGIYLGTNGGVYVWDLSLESWVPWGFELRGRPVLSLSVESGPLSAVTSGGVYVWKEGARDKVLKRIKYRFSDEPTVQEVQEKAIQYAEVSHDKIRVWRKQARKRALFPDVSVNYTSRRDDTYEIYTSSSTNYSVSGPEDGTDTWSIGLSWDLGDLVFSSDQTSIDVRSRLMVQLREDVLDEVTRLYYERRRVQISHWSQKDVPEEKLVLEMLRIDELTAGLDAYTQGWFSRNIGAVQTGVSKQ